jgi:hypothetical protein
VVSGRPQAGDVVAQSRCRPAFMRVVAGEVRSRDVHALGSRDEIVEVRMFGPLELRIDGSRLGPRDFGGVRPEQVLEVLLLERRRLVAKDRIAELLWGAALPQRVAATVETLPGGAPPRWSRLASAPIAPLGAVITPSAIATARRAHGPRALSDAFVETGMVTGWPLAALAGHGCCRPSDMRAEAQLERAASPPCRAALAPPRPDAARPPVWRAGTPVRRHGGAGRCSCPRWCRSSGAGTGGCRPASQACCGSVRRRSRGRDVAGVAHLEPDRPQHGLVAP